jgi:hypothetical protein
MEAIFRRIFIPELARLVMEYEFRPKCGDLVAIYDDEEDVWRLGTVVGSGSAIGGVFSIGIKLRINYNGWSSHFDAVVPAWSSSIQPSWRLVDRTVTRLSRKDEWGNVKESMRTQGKCV